MASSPLPCSFGKKEAWMPTGEDVRVRGQKRRMREEMTLTLTLIAMDGGVSDGAV